MRCQLYYQLKRIPHTFVIAALAGHNWSQRLCEANCLKLRTF